MNSLHKADVHMRSGILPFSLNRSNEPRPFDLQKIGHGGCGTSERCILGLHNAVGSQTLASVDFDTSEIFVSPVPDVSGTSHEVAEWMDDPFGNNPTPAWGHTWDRWWPGRLAHQRWSSAREPSLPPARSKPVFRPTKPLGMRFDSRSPKRTCMPATNSF